MQISDSPILKAIHERRSIRKFTDESVSRDLIMTALEAASSAVMIKSRETDSSVNFRMLRLS